MARTAQVSCPINTLPVAPHLSAPGGAAPPRPYPLQDPAASPRLERHENSLANRASFSWGRTLAAALTLFLAGAAVAAPQVGQPAPDFTGKDSKGNPVSLSEYRGKTVVLEWTNADCPYTMKHYSSGNMQSMQSLAKADGIVWLSIVSSAPGKQGYVTGSQADSLTSSRKAAPTAVLLDPAGDIGRLYQAKTTPHLFVVDKNGTLQYMGGIDSVATANIADIPKAEPYLKEAMLAVQEGRPVAHAVTKPYGCSIKY